MRNFDSKIEQKNRRKSKRTKTDLYCDTGSRKRENEIAKEVARELDKRGYGKKEKKKSPSLTMSPYGFMGGY